MTALQVVATLVGIPVGLASAYSIYHSNFTDEARCETLRGNIVSMLDKSADASTLRMLVRRDVVTFENNCGSVDPDAVTAFKTLLARKPAAPPQAVRQPVAEPGHEAKKSDTAKAIPAPIQAAPVERRAGEVKSVETKSVARTTEESDAKWIASVRDALIRAPAAQADLPPGAPATTAAPPHPLGELRVVPETPAAAPTLPAPAAIAVAPKPADPGDHPVPPGSIPAAHSSTVEMSPANDAPPAKESHSWMANIPVLSRFVGK